MSCSALNDLASQILISGPGGAPRGSIDMQAGHGNQEGNCVGDYLVKGRTQEAHESATSPSRRAVQAV